MTARESYFFEQVIQSHNELIVNFKLMSIERDTLIEEKSNLQTELFKVYQELAELKGVSTKTPFEMDFMKKFENSNEDKYKLMM